MGMSLQLDWNGIGIILHHPSVKGLLQFIGILM